MEETEVKDTKPFPKKIVLKIALNRLNKLNDEEWAQLYEFIDYLHGGYVEEDEYDHALLEARKHISAFFKCRCKSNLCKESVIDPNVLLSAENTINIPRLPKKQLTLKKSQIPKEKMNA